MKQEKRKSKTGTPGSSKPDKKRRPTSGAGLAAASEQLEELPCWSDHNGLSTARMLHGQVLLFTGQGLLQVLSGTLEVDGFLLEAGHPPLPVSTGPPGSLAITLTARSNNQQVPRAAQDIISFTVHSPAIGINGSSSPSVAAASLLPTTVSNSVDVSSTPFQLHHPAVQQPSHLPHTSVSQQASQSSSPASMLVPSDWSEAVSQVTNAAAAHMQGQGPHVSVMVVGPKGVGKSSLARLLVNHLLSQHLVVAWMDTDCGQCEVTPSGMVSITLLTQPLIGPACTHMQQTHFAHYIGDVSPQSDPIAYSAALVSLYRWYCSETCLQQAAQAVQNQTASTGPSSTAATANETSATWPPLIINTHGWVKGVGLELLAELANTVAPSHVIQVRSRHHRRNPPPGAFWWMDDITPCPTQVIDVNSPPHHHKQHAQVQLPDQEADQPAPEPVLTLAETTVQGRKGGTPMKSVPAGSAAAVVQTVPGALISTGNISSGTVAGGEGEWGEEGQGEEGAAMGSGAQGLTAVESRSLQWHAWAKAACGLDPKWGGYTAWDQYNTVMQLCCMAPYIVNLDDVQLQFMHTESPADHLLGVAMNGVVVGLSGHAQSPPLNGNDAASTGSVPLPCYGVGLVRAVNMTTRQLYILTPVPSDVLQQVSVLQVGRAAAEVPISFLHAGALSAVSPYLSLFSLGGGSGAALGASSGKTRRNLGRARLGA